MIDAPRLAAMAAVLFCCSGAALVPASDAGAPLRARLKVTLTGVDDSHWNYRVPPPSGGSLRCTPRERIGSGTQTIRYASARTFVLSAKSSPDGMPKLAPGALDGVRFPVNAMITRQSSDTGNGCPSVDLPPGAPDCGTKSFSVLGNLRYLRRARVGFFTMAASLRSNVFRNCPNFFGVVGREDSLGVGLRNALARLPQRTLFDRSKQRLVVKGSGSEQEKSSLRAVVFQSSWRAVLRRLR